MKKEYILPKGFFSAGINAGIKESPKLDAGMIFSRTDCAAVGFFTKNRLKSVHILEAKKIINGKIRAIFSNSGSANALTGKAGHDNLKAIVKAASGCLHVKPEQILAAATGKISKRIPVNNVVAAMPELVSALSAFDSKFPEAIMTTDTVQKFATAAVNIGGKKCVITAAGKGSGMISPNMATMLVFCMTDASMDKKLLKKPRLKP